MTIAAWTPKAVVELFPKFLTKRRVGFGPRLDAMATELGLKTRLPLLLTNVAVQFAVDGVLTEDRLRWRSPYATKLDGLRKDLDAAAAAGLLAKETRAWRPTQTGKESVFRMHSEARRYLADLALPAEPTRRAADGLAALAARVPDAGRAATARRIGPTPEQRRADLVRLEQAIITLWLFRDDCHVAAWQASAYRGPDLDVLSQLWEGKSTEEAMQLLAPRQERRDLERTVEALITRADLAREGESLRITEKGKESRDRVERETDRLYFDVVTGEDLARVGPDLQTVIDALPAAP